jgi:hypothetical protein
MFDNFIIYNVYVFNNMHLQKVICFNSPEILYTVGDRQGRSSESEEPRFLFRGLLRRVSDFS